MDEKEIRKIRAMIACKTVSQQYQSAEVLGAGYSAAELREALEAEGMK